MVSTTIVLIRHGQSTWNAQGRWQGQADPPLSELGRRQARTASQELGRLFPKLAGVVSSPQRRAAETAQIMLANQSEGGSAHQEAAPAIQFLEGLRERSAGPWSGLTRNEINTDYPGFLAKDLRPEGFEGDAPLFTRVVNALNSIEFRPIGAELDFPASREQIILAVCHGGVIGTLVQGLINGESARVPNLSGWTVTKSEDGLRAGSRIDLLPPGDRTGGDSVAV